MGNKYGDIRYKWLAERGFNVKSDQYQLSYVESLWNKNKQIIFNNSRSGTGKTTLAVLTGVYEMELGNYDKLIYIRNAVPVRNQGFLKGDINEKEAPYMQPLIDALEYVKLGTFEAWANEEDKGNHKVFPTTSSYLRGVNFKNAWILIDESQNIELHELQTILTRVHDSCKVVMVGCSLQNDNTTIKLINGYNPFELYIEHYKEKEYASNHILRTNYRGDLANHADDIYKTINKLNKI